MLLNRANLSEVNRLAYNNSIRDTKRPVRVLLFGTGVLLRGLPVYCIDEANQQELFHGDVAMVKSTKSGGIESFKEQDCLYTIHIRGVDKQSIVDRKQLVTSVQDILDANTSWSQILELAKDPQINIIISNTTEKGIVDVDDDILAMPPESFPGKITAYLYHRFQHLGATEASKIIVLPTELIDDNAECLKEIILNKAMQNNLGDSFASWVETFVHFCNTLVDRIVPGSYFQPDLGYDDQLAIAVEPYYLWAIESTSPYVLKQLEFLTLSSNVTISSSISNIKEIKLRVLNATHTLMAAMAILSGHKYVKNTFEEELYTVFLKDLLNKEIIPCLEQNGINKEQAVQFSKALLDRFKNPFIDHQWLSIAQNYHAKIKSRVLPLLNYWYNFHDDAPVYISFGLATYLYLLHKKVTDIEPEITLMMQGMNDADLGLLLSNEELWGMDLTKFNGLVEAIKRNIQILEEKSVNNIIKTL